MNSAVHLFSVWHFQWKKANRSEISGNHTLHCRAIAYHERLNQLKTFSKQQDCFFFENCGCFWSSVYFLNFHNNPRLFVILVYIFHISKMFLVCLWVYLLKWIREEYAPFRVALIEILLRSVLSCPNYQNCLQSSWKSWVLTILFPYAVTTWSFASSYVLLS